MVLPTRFVGDDYLIRDIDGTGSLFRYRARNVQGKPYDHPSAFYIMMKKTLHAERRNNPTYGGFANACAGKAGERVPIYAYSSDLDGAVTGDFSSPLAIGVLQKARARFVDKMSSAAALAVSLAERHQAMEMVGARLGQILRFTKKINRFDLLGAAAELSLDPRPASERVKRRLSKRLRDPNPYANAWLEFQFGWAPLVSDITSACELLSEPINDRLVVGRAHHSVVREDAWGTATSTTSTEGFAVHQLKYSAVVASYFRVTNPNLFLANRLGLINPATLVEIIPFSFVANWFFNINEFFGQWTEGAGVTLVKPFHSQKFVDYCQGREIFGSKLEPQHNYQLYVTSSSLDFKRKLNIPNVVFTRRPPWVLEGTRAGNVAALLTQQLSNMSGTFKKAYRARGTATD